MSERRFSGATNTNPGAADAAANTIRRAFDLLGASPAPLMIAEAGGDVHYANAAFSAAVASETDPRLAELVAEAMPRALARESFTMKWRNVPDASRDPSAFDIHISPICGEKGVDGFLAIASDVTATALAVERRKKAHFSEQHRVRNILALIRSVVSRTRGSAAPLEDVVDHLADRIDALTRIQSKIMRDPRGFAEIGELLLDEINAQADPEQRDRVAIDGPSLMLDARCAETLGLVFHELSVNALKFGGLGSPSGRIVIGWSVDGTVSPPVLHLTWTETGIRVLSANPRREGFGQSFISEAIPYDLGGEADWQFSPGKLVYELTIPLEA